MALVAGAAMLASPHADAGKLDDIRDEVHGSSSDDDDGDDSGSSSSIFDDDDDDDWNEPTYSSGGSPAALMVLRIIAWPWTLPGVLIEGTGPSHGYLVGYPYANGAPGHMTIVRLEEPELQLVGAHPGPGSKPTDHVSAGLTLQYAYDLDAVHQPTLEARIDTSFRLGLQTAWTMLLEPLGTGVLDRLTIGSIDLSIRHVQHEHVEMHTGIGLRLMIDQGHVDRGFDFFYSADVFPVKPLVLSARVELGSLGNAFLVHGRGHVGVTFHGIEVFAGYEAWQIGRVVMHGPLAGIRLWL